MIADGHALVRGAISALLDAEDDMDVVGEAGDGDEAFALAERERPDVVLLDFDLPGLDGLETTRRIFSEPALEGVRVIVLSVSDADDHLFGALRAGASAFLVKDTEPAELLEAVRAVVHGEALLSRGVTRRLIAEVASQPDRLPAEPRGARGADRSRARGDGARRRGLSNQEIAERLVISLATAKTHVSRALRKVDARDRAQLVALAYETGLVHPRRDGTAALAAL